MDIKANLFELLKVILLGVVNIVGIYATIYLNKLKEKAISEINKNNIIKENAQKDLIKNAINRLDDLITESVESAQLTTVKEIKESNTDNIKEQLNKLKEEMIVNVVGQLSTKSKELINMEINDINSYVSTKIESTLGELKGNNSYK